MTDEPLTVIAPLAREAAATHCRTNGGGEADCDWYHGTLAYLRILDLVISPVHHREFFVSAFASLAADPSFRKVLVSGAGDCSMMAHVLAGFQAAAAEPAITVFDRCETPLVLNRWLAEREGLAIETVKAEALEFDSDGVFDAICTHCFLGYFPPDVRPGLLARWHGLLRPGGRLLTVNPVRKTPDYSLARFSAEQAASLEERALRAARARPDVFGDDLEWFRERLRDYTANFCSYPVRSIDEVHALFEAAGFTMQATADLSACAPALTERPGPTEVGLNYVGFIAARS